MAQRPSFGHMDYEWQNQSGPLGPEHLASPFAAVSSKTARTYHENTPKNHFGAFGARDDVDRANLGHPPSNYTGFSTGINSPAKNSLLERSVYNTPAFTTPRRYDTDYPSSGVETSPENQADSEATPEIGVRSAASGPSKDLVKLNAKRENLDRPSESFQYNGTKLRASGKGEISRSGREAASKRVQKRRRPQDSAFRIGFIRTRRGSGSDSDRDLAKKKSIERIKSEKATSDTGWLGSAFGFIETHPNVPHILAFYFHLLLNAFLVLFFMYLIYSFWSTIRADVDKKSTEATVEVMAEMATCARDYAQNRCDASDRAPALDTICDRWQRCLNQNPKAIGRARVSAHTFAEILNSFIEPISVKAYAFCLVGLFGTLALSNFAFSHMQRKDNSHVPIPTQFQTPQREFVDQQNRVLQWQSPQAYHSPNKNASMPISGLPSPVRQLDFR